MGDVGRRFVQRACAAVAAFAFSLSVHGQQFPTKPVHLVVPFSAGGTTDVLARIFGDRLSKRLGQPVVVQNRPGAGGSLGAQAVANAEPDGYTLLMGTSGTLAINPNIYKTKSYDPARDFAPVALLGSTPYVVLVHPSFPATTIQEFVALARAKPGQLNYGSAGNGSTGHLMGELFASMAGVTLTHIAYKGQAPAMADLIGGQINALFEPIGTALIQLKTGKVRALATTGVKRSPLAPSIPTLAESGLPGYEASAWFAIVAPAGTPKEIVGRLNRELNEALLDPEIRPQLAAQQFDVATPDSPDRLGTYIRSEIAKWGKVVKDSGATVN